jgi:ADP-heptose:LPS heptosyltransferase
MASRSGPRLAIIGRALLRRALGGRRGKPHAPQRILIAHHLLLGDTLMLTPLVAKLRKQYPDAAIVMTVPKAFAPLFAHRPYGMRALEWDPRDAASVRRLLAEPPFDLAFIPGDNRHAWLAQAMRARWIVAFAGDRPGYKSWPVDELREYPSSPGSWYDITATLVDGPPPPAFALADWGSPYPQRDLAPRPPRSPYAVLHVGASARLKLWPTSSWRALAAALRSRGLAVIWSAGPGESQLVDACEPEADDIVTAGRLDLAQLFSVLRDAALLVAPDTGVAHLGRIAGVPTVALFGPGSALLAGHGDFWRNCRYRALTIDPFPCRDQHVLFKREVAWVTICKRAFAECGSPRCMAGLAVRDVLTAFDEMTAN